MIRTQFRVAPIALCAALIAQPALADDYLFKGDCERARIVQSERTIDRVMRYANYAGTQRLRYDNDTCGRDTYLVVSLKQSERTTAKVVYSLERSDLFRGISTACPTVENKGYVGSVTFTVQQRQTGTVCEVYIWSDWTTRSTTSSWTNNFSNRVTPLNDHSFVITQAVPSGKKYWTPLAFTGTP